MENTNSGMVLAILGLVASLMGNLVQYFFPTKKSKVEDTSIAAATAKIVAETYAIMTDSLKKRIENLEDEALDYRKVIESLEKKIESQDELIESLRKEIKELKDQMK
jgi:predicted  nucleic acid-binding Zn-ribbon protein